MEENTCVEKKLPDGAMSLIFWGLLMEFLDFRINGFDLLPDGVGVIMVIIGLSQLVGTNEFFRKARLFYISSLVLIFAMMGFVLAEELFAVLVAVGNKVAIAVGMIALYFLCKGIATFSQEVGNEDLSLIAMQRFKIFAVVALLGYAFMLVVPALAFMSLVCIGFAYIYILSLIYKAKCVL